MNSNSGNGVRKICPSKVKKAGGNTLVLILSWIIFLLIIFFVLYFIIATVMYLTTTCYQKNPYFSYLFGFKLSNVCKYKYPPQTEAERVVENEKEVFHVGHQVLTYDQAKCKCAAYGARLATKNEVINAYNKGANWCTYGWSEGQNAYYPVQKCFWDDMQNDPTKKNSCGHPGINGGFFANPQLKFGANCYGFKPDGTVAIPKEPTCEQKGFCERVENTRYAEESTLDDIVPFNRKTWSQYTN